MYTQYDLAPKHTAATNDAYRYDFVSNKYHHADQANQPTQYAADAVGSNNGNIIMSKKEHHLIRCFIRKGDFV